MPDALALIAAVSSNRVIGREGRLPWHLPEDLRRFRTLTTGHSIIMGRRTWDSLPRALPDRQNIVVTRQPAFEAQGALVVRSLDDGLARVDLPGPAFCIGGGDLFRLALPMAKLAYVTEIQRAFDGDATFPVLDPSQWNEIERESHVQPEGERLPYAFVTYRRHDHF
jgi:dihydrofolate reductase